MGNNINSSLVNVHRTATVADARGQEAVAPSGTFRGAALFPISKKLFDFLKKSLPSKSAATLKVDKCQ